MHPELYEYPSGSEKNCDAFVTDVNVLSDVFPSLTILAQNSTRTDTERLDQLLQNEGLSGKEVVQYEKLVYSLESLSADISTAFIFISSIDSDSDFSHCASEIEQLAIKYEGFKYAEKLIHNEHESGYASFWYRFYER